jgi:molybdate/tungstate transport system permease protein
MGSYLWRVPYKGGNVVANKSRQKDTVWILSIAGGILLVLPILVLLYYGFVIYRSSAGFSTPVFQSILLTLVTSAISAAVVFLLFTPLAYELATSRHSGLESISDIPASIPHPIVGIAFLILGSPFTPTGRFLASIGISFFDSIQGIVIALTFVSAPIYIRTMQSVFSSRKQDADLYTMSLGTSRIKMLYGAILPSLKRETLYAGLTSMSRGMSEFGSIAILAYYVTQYPFTGVSNASVLIYNYYGYLGPGVAVTASAVMIVVSIAVLAVARLFGRTWNRGSLSNND